MMPAPTEGYDLTQQHPLGWCIPDPLPNDGQRYKPFTVEHWLYLYSLPDNMGLLTVLLPGQAWNAGPLNLYLRSQAGAGYSFSAGGKSARGGTPPIGEWAHLAWVFTGSRIKVFENGIEIADASLANVPVGCGFFHGNYNNNTRDTINGLVARLRFWDKAFDASDAVAARDSIYNSNEPGLIVQYELGDPAPGVFGKPDRPYQYALLLNRDPSIAPDLVANRMGYVYPAPAYDRPKEAEISGLITDANGQPCQRKVYAVTRPTDGTAPEVVAHGLSDPATGEYTLGLPTTAEVSRVVVSEDDDSPLLNDLIDRIIPE